MKEFSDFVTWEAKSRDTIDFKKIYVDIADGDIIAGLTLSEIVYWYLPDNEGKTKLRVEHDGKLWIAAPRAEWWERCRISPRQSDRALKILKNIGLIETKRYKWFNVPTVHIRIVESRFIELWDKFLNHPAVNPNLPNGEMEITNPLNLVTENTTENTTEKKDSADLPIVANSVAIQSSESPQAKEVKTVQPHIAIIDAYWAGLPGGKPIKDDYPRHLVLAAKMRDAGITPEQITKFLAAVYDPNTTVWEYKKCHNRAITLEEVSDLLPVWWDKHKPKVLNLGSTSWEEINAERAARRKRNQARFAAGEFDDILEMTHDRD